MFLFLKLPPAFPSQSKAKTHSAFSNSNTKIYHIVCRKGKSNLEQSICEPKKKKKNHTLPMNN